MATGRARLEGELARFLDSDARLALPASAAPEVSILIVLFNQAPLTLACLRAIVATVQQSAEVIIVDNASSDATGALLDRLDGAIVSRNTENRHYLHGVNQAAALARGRALLLLNNDACLRPGSRQAAGQMLFSAADIGAVGGPIILPDGRLQEAGSIVWRDGSCLGYGRGGDPAAAEFQFPRAVDYCSGAFLLLRHDVFRALGGLDPAFAPAYYEETDFCMRLRAAGYRVLYEPRAAVDHYEFASAAKPEAALALQRAHRAQFAARHAAALGRAHWPAGSPPLLARTHGTPRGRVLVIDDRIPYPELGAGNPRAAMMLRQLMADGWLLTHYPLQFPQDSRAAIEAAFPRGMEVMLGLGPPGLRRFLVERLALYDLVLISRPHNLRLFHLAARGLAARRLIYDAEALVAPREVQRRALAGKPLGAAAQAAMLQREMRLARGAQTIATVAEAEAALFRAGGCADVRVLGHALTPQPGPAAPAGRADLLFVGALETDPSPNVDSLLWFVAEVMPRLDGLIGTGWRLLVAGRCRAERIRLLAGPRVQLLRQVEDLTPLYDTARVFVAPTRYAAGIPHKVHEAAAHGLPVVVTPLLADQLGWQNGQALLTGESAEAFAAACARLYRDDALWSRLRTQALARLAQDCDPAVFAAQLRAIVEPPPGAAPILSPAAPPRAPAPPARGGLPIAAGLRALRRDGAAATAWRVMQAIGERRGR
jgi:GT2 family glycosyltransferase